MVDASNRNTAGHRERDPMGRRMDGIGQSPDTDSLIRILEYSRDLRQAWSDYENQAANATVAHRIGFRDVIRKSLGHKPRYLIALDGSTVRGILPLFVVTTWWRAKYVVSIPWLDYGGPCADNREIAKALLDRAVGITKQEGASFLEFRSVGNYGIGMQERLDKASFVLKLENDPELLWNRFDAKLRNQIRKSQKSGLTAEIGGVEMLDDFYAIFSRNMRDLGTPVWGKALIRNVLQEFDQDAEIVLVRAHDAAVAGGLILTFKDRQYIPAASSYRWSLKYCPNQALYWSVIKRACEKGYEYFDFGRSSWDSGTFGFKKQWGAPPEQLVWQYYLNKVREVPRISPENPKYRMAVRLWRKMPLWLANVVGPRLIRNFP